MSDSAFAIVANDRIVEARNADAIVPWWSFTKTALAAAALALVRDGLLALDAPMPGRAFSLRQLLQHRAGVANYGGLPAYHDAVDRGDAPWPMAVLLEKTAAERPHTRPGTGFSYSNIGYAFVRQAIERATGTDLDTALQRLLIAPLGIARTRLLTGRGADPIVGIRRGYDAGWVYHGLLVGPLRSAVLLLHRLLRGDLLPPPLLAAMTAGLPVGAAIPGRPWTQPAYGLGLMCGDSRHGRVAGHTGGGPDSAIAIYDGARASGAFATGDDANAIEDRAIAAACG